MSQSISRTYLHAAERSIAGHNASEQGRRAPSAEPRTFPVIAIGGAHGARREEVAKRVAEALGYRCLDQEILNRISERAHVSVGQVSVLDEHRIDQLSELMVSFGSQSHFHAAEYRRELGRVIRQAVDEGAAVIVGHGGRYFLGAGPGLRVYITAPLDKRVQWTAADREITIDVARSDVHRADQDRADFVRDYFDADPHHPERESDLVIDVGVLGVQGAVDTILAAYASRFMPDRD